MTDTLEILRDELVTDICLWLNDEENDSDKYTFDKKWEDGIESWGGLLSSVNRIGLKRLFGKELLARGYTKVSTSPPRWIKNPIVCQQIIPSIPAFVVDTYLSLLQAQAVIEKEYPDIMKQTAREG